MQLYLYEESKDKHPTDGTALEIEEAREIYMKKVQYLKDERYKVENFHIEKLRYEDGHTFFLEILLDVEQGDQHFQWKETVDIWNGKVWVIEKEDPYATYRDGKMNVEWESREIRS